MKSLNSLIVGISSHDLSRFRSKYVVRENGCWEWTCSKTTEGYGRIQMHREAVLAHRISFYLANGYLPVVTDHLCRNRVCVNPQHLESVDDLTNSRRGLSPIAANGRKTHCANGHEFSEANTIRRMSRGKFRRRDCRECFNAKKRRSYAKHPRKRSTKAKEVRKS